MAQLDLFKRALDTQVCFDLLSVAKPGDTIPWSDFVKATGQELDRIRSNISSARRALEGDEYRAVFATVKGIGLRRAANKEIPGTAEEIQAHIRRRANVGIRRLKCAEYESLDDTGKLTWNTQMTVLALHQKAANSSTRKRIEAAVAQTQAQLPIAKALKVLGVATNGDAPSIMVTR